MKNKKQKILKGRNPLIAISPAMLAVLLGACATLHQSGIKPPYYDAEHLNCVADQLENYPEKMKECSMQSLIDWLLWVDYYDK